MAPRVIRELWLVEAVGIFDDGMRVEFDSRQGTDKAPSTIVQHEDGDTTVQVSTEEGKWYAKKIGARVHVTLTIGEDDAPQAVRS